MQGAPLRIRPFAVADAARVHPACSRRLRSPSRRAFITLPPNLFSFVDRRAEIGRESLCDSRKTHGRSTLVRALPFMLCRLVGFPREDAQHLFGEIPCPYALASSHGGQGGTMGKVFKGLLVLLALAFAGLVFRLVLFYAGAAWIERSFQVAIRQSQASAAFQMQHAQLVAKQQQVAWTARSRHLSPPRQLAPDERCVGGSIVRLQVMDHVPTYTQPLGPDGRPIMCPEQ